MKSQKVTINTLFLLAFIILVSGQISIAQWTNSDVGAVGAAGSYSESGGQFTILGSGSDVWSTADEFHYVYQTVNNDVEIICRLLSMDNTNDWAKSGLMIRETLDNNSKHAIISVTPDDIALFQPRVTTGGGMTSTQETGHSLPRWLKLNRTGNVITGEISADGVSWSTVASVTVSMNSNVYAGMFVCSHNDGVLNTSVFDNVSISVDGNTPPVADAGTYPIITDSDDSGDEDVTLDGSGSDDSDGSITQWVWTEGSTTLGTTEYLTVTLSVGTHIINLQVTDNDNATDNDQVTITVNPPSGGTGESVWDENASGAYYMGNVGIGNQPLTDYRLAVDGKIIAKEIKVEASPWADFVFDENYALRNLEEVEKYIQQEKHLPGVPSASMVEEEGVNLGEMNAILLQKIEEMTIYIIELNKKIEAQQNEIEELKRINKGQ